MLTIDYAVGGLGNTILSHILYACNKADIDLTTLFNQATGDAHARRAQYTSPVLNINHCSISDNAADRIDHCFLQVISSSPANLLVTRMGYLKFVEQVPTSDNYSAFNIKIGCLHDTNFVELLAYFYESWHYELVNATHQMELMDYISGDDSKLKLIATELEWSWDAAKSAKFFKLVRKANEDHISWYNTIVKYITDTISFKKNMLVLEDWEKAATIVEICKSLAVRPSELHWGTHDYFSAPGNIDLINDIKQILQQRNSNNQTS